MAQATLRDVIGSRAVLNDELRAREARTFDSLAPEMQRAAFVHAKRVLHEVMITLQNARDGVSTFRNDRDTLSYIEQLVWSQPDALTEPPARLA